MADQSQANVAGFWQGLLSKAPAHDKILGRISHFPIERVLFTGPTRAFFQSADELTDRPVLLAIFADGAGQVENARFKLLPGHDFLYPVHEVLEISGHPALVLPSLAGLSLSELIKSQQRLSIAMSLRIVTELLVALSVGHDRGLIHGDLGAEWVWLEPESMHVRLMGMGWRLLEPSGTGELASFLSSGTSRMPAPEITEGGKPGPASDLFSAGMLLYQLLTGKSAYEGNSPLELIRSLAMAEPQRPGELRQGISPELDQFVMRLLSRRPSDRPGSAREAAILAKELAKKSGNEKALETPEIRVGVGAGRVPVASADDDIQLAPIDDKPVITMMSGGASGNAIQNEIDDDNALIDFYQGPEKATTTKEREPKQSADDDMLIELLPIDDAPPIPAAAPRRAEKTMERGAVRQSSVKEASWQGLQVPLDWVYVADSPIEAVHLAGESQMMVVRDQSGQVKVLSSEGEVLATDTATEPIRLSAADQSGLLMAMVLGKRKLAFFDWDLNLLVERNLHSEPVAIAVDSLGLYVAVSFLGKETWIYTRQGKKIAEFETRQPISRMAFVPGSSRLVGSTTFDQLVCAEISRSRDDYDADIVWIQNTGVGVGHIHVIGNSGKVLASCNNMGLQRLDVDGENEGTYQLGGTVIESAADFPGRFFLASTLEGSLLAVNANGSIMWEHGRGGPWKHLTIDPLGRFALAASAMGELVCMDLSTEPRGRVDHSSVQMISSSGASGNSSIKSPEWSIRISDALEDNLAYSLAVCEKPFRACVLDSKKVLSCFTALGDEAEKLPGLGGSGRLLKAAEGWVAAGNEQKLRLVNFTTQEVLEPDLALVQVTHFQMKPQKYGLLIIQEGDRLGRASLDGRWIWRIHLPATVESLVLSDDGYTALSLDNSQVGVMGPAGKGVGKWSAGEREAVLLCESQSKQDGLCRWVSLARSERVLRGHSLDLRLLWQVEVPFAGWELVRSDEGVIVVANDKSAILYDDAGEILAKRRGNGCPTKFASDRDGKAIAIHVDAGILYCTRFDGSVLWRLPIEGDVSSMQISREGVLILAGGVLSWIRLN
jgi:hypothetical protein